MNATLYVEGGGDRNKTLNTQCRKGFSKFIEQAGLKNRMPRIVACGGRRQAFDSFRTALAGHDRTTSPVLLVDSEGPVLGMDPWQHVGQRQGDQWQRPDGALDDQLHLMVETMEAWFYGDREALQKFYGPTFRASALSARTNVETIPKGELVSGLKAATSNCQKGEYAKGAHSFLILEQLHPARVRAASPIWCERFLRSLDQISR